MFRPVVTTTAPVVNAIVTNSLYQPQQQLQQQQTFVTAQNHLPKIGAIKATTLGAQPKVLNIVAPLKQQQQQQPQPTLIATTTTATPTIIQNTNNTIQHIKTAKQPTLITQPIIHNGNAINVAAVTTSTTHNIINTTQVASQIISNRNQSPAIHTESIKSEALVTSSTFVSKAATSNTNVQIPNTASTNSVVPAAAVVTAAPAATTVNANAVANSNKQNLNNKTNTNTQLDTNKTDPKTEKKTEPAAKTEPIVEQSTNDNNENNDDENEPEPEIDIVINNVVCSFSVRCHLNLREIALNGRNVEFRRENGMVTMKLRRPYTTASIWSSGRITCTGATSEDQVCNSLFLFPFKY